MVELTKRCQGTAVQPGSHGQKWLVVFFFKVKQKKGGQIKQTSFRDSFKVMIIPRSSEFILIELGGAKNGSAKLAANIPLL